MYLNMFKTEKVKDSRCIAPQRKERVVSNIYRVSQEKLTQENCDHFY